MDARRVTSALLAVAALTAATQAALAQRRPPAAAPAVPTLAPLVHTCPMHPDVVEAAAGSCPLCKMNLVATRLEASWMCPVHAAVVEEQRGTCRLCSRDLVPVTVSLSWTCRGDVNAEHLDPGRCPDGTPRIAKRTLRPHGNHNPQHGGQFFMAPDSWHHLEGTYPSRGLFRLHVYDDYARPLSTAQLRAIRGRLVADERVDPVTRAAVERVAIPLRVSTDGRTLEGVTRHAAWPVRLTAKLTLKDGQPEYRFDFTFAAQTRDTGAVSAATAQRPRVATRRSSEPSTRGESSSPSEAGRSATSSSTGTTQAAPADDVAATPPPTTIPAILDALRAYEREVASLVERGEFGAIWVPAFQAKDVALSLEAQLDHLPAAARQEAQPAVFAVVQSAWRLDAVGDGGNRDEIEAAHRTFRASLQDVVRAFTPR